MAVKPLISSSTTRLVSSDNPREIVVEEARRLERLAAAKGTDPFERRKATILARTLRDGLELKRI